ncbi:uncharacterized protein LOC135383287 [Ornithodoros turicata]|uniref:uncharacterized protein LOC135383287 n=1 Tax=Ornithodoros turicata TaxID=34597 RepID=UPI00313911DF
MGDVPKETRWTSKVKFFVAIASPLCLSPMLFIGTPSAKCAYCLLLMFCTMTLGTLPVPVVALIPIVFVRLFEDLPSRDPLLEATYSDLLPVIGFICFYVATYSRRLSTRISLFLLRRFGACIKPLYYKMMGLTFIGCCLLPSALVALLLIIMIIKLIHHIQEDYVAAVRQRCAQRAAERQRLEELDADTLLETLSQKLKPRSKFKSGEPTHQIDAVMSDIMKRTFSVPVRRESRISFSLPDLSEEDGTSSRSLSEPVKKRPNKTSNETKDTNKSKAKSFNAIAPKEAKKEVSTKVGVNDREKERITNVTGQGVATKNQAGSKSDSRCTSANPSVGQPCNHHGVPARPIRMASGAEVNTEEKTRAPSTLTQEVSIPKTVAPLTLTADAAQSKNMSRDSRSRRRSPSGGSLSSYDQKQRRVSSVSFHEINVSPSSPSDNIEIIRETAQVKSTSRDTKGMGRSMSQGGYSTYDRKERHRSSISSNGEPTSSISVDIIAGQENQDVTGSSSILSTISNLFRRIFYEKRSEAVDSAHTSRSHSQTVLIILDSEAAGETQSAYHKLMYNNLQKALVFGVAYTSIIAGECNYSTSRARGILSNFYHSRKEQNPVEYFRFTAITLPASLGSAAVLWFALYKIYLSQYAYMGDGLYNEIATDFLKAHRTVRPLRTVDVYYIIYFLFLIVMIFLYHMAFTSEYINDTTIVYLTLLPLAGGLCERTSIFLHGEPLMSTVLVSKIPWYLIVLRLGGGTLANTMVAANLGPWLFQTIVPAVRGVGSLVTFTCALLGTSIINEIDPESLGDRLLPCLPEYWETSGFELWNIALPVAVISCYTFFMLFTSTTLIFLSHYAGVEPIEMVMPSIFLKIVTTGFMVVSIGVYQWLEESFSDIT